MLVTHVHTLSVPHFPLFLLLFFSLILCQASKHLRTRPRTLSDCLNFCMRVGGGSLSGCCCLSKLIVWGTWTHGFGHFAKFFFMFLSFAIMYTLSVIRHPSAVVFIFNKMLMEGPQTSVLQCESEMSCESESVPFPIFWDCIFYLDTWPFTYKLSDILNTVSISRCRHITAQKFITTPAHEWKRQTNKIDT